MQTCRDYLRAAKVRLGVTSDYALAKALELTRSGVSRLQSGSTTFDDDTAMRVAAILEVNPAQVIAAAHAERARDPKLKTVWEGIAAKVAAGVLVAIGAATIAPSPARADSGAAGCSPWCRPSKTTSSAPPDRFSQGADGRICAPRPARPIIGRCASICSARSRSPGPS